MLVDRLRLVGSAQTSKAMEAEFIRLAWRAAQRRPDRPKRQGTGQLLYPFDAQLADVALAYARTPTRIVRDLAELSATRLEPLFEELYADIAQDRREFWAGARTISIDAVRTEWVGANPRQVVGTAKNAICDALSTRGQALKVDAANPDLALSLRGHESGLTLCLDLTGETRTRRGWRTQQVEAPLREHLAAVLLMLTRFDARHDVLIDPMCGSGTIPIEAYGMARGEGVGQGGLMPPLFADASPLIIGRDIDVAALIACKQNAVNAGAEVDWARGDVASLTPDWVASIAAPRGKSVERGVILANPPYGNRLEIGDDEGLALFESMAATCRRFHGWRAGFIVDHPEFERIFNMRPAMKKPLANANLRSYFYLYEIA